MASSSCWRRSAAVAAAPASVTTTVAVVPMALNDRAVSPGAVAAGVVEVAVIGPTSLPRSPRGTSC